ARQAVEISQSAVLSMPSEAGLHNTLGVALFRTGNWKDAVGELEKGIELKKSGDAYDGFFLAMSHWQLGDRDAARNYFARGVEWMEKNRPQDAELRRFRAEAVGLLGIKEREAMPPKP